MYIYQIMSNSFGYLDIILLGMIAGFIILRLRSILGRKTGHESKVYPNFAEKKFSIPKKEAEPVTQNLDVLEGKEKKEFLKGAEIAYETIVTNFSMGKLKDIKTLLDALVYEQFNTALDERKSKNYSSETTFVGIQSAEIKHHQQNKNMLEVTVEFVSEIISCIRDKDNNIVSGDPKKVKKVNDVWKFSKDSTSANPNWLLIDTQA